MPMAAKLHLARLVIRMDAEMRLPKQAARNLTLLTPKPSGGDRPITLASTLYFIWCGARMGPLQ